MKILKKHKTIKPEDTSIIPFLEFMYRMYEEISFSAIQEDSNKRPDYYIETTNDLVEIKEIHDRYSNQKHAQWGKIANKLQKATNDNELLKKVKGTYLVNTPEVFKLYKFEETSSQVLQEIINGVDKQKTIIISKISFEINKVSDQENIVVYGSMGGAGFIDPANIVFQNIKDKIETANKQLSFNPNNQKPSKRILLLVNKYYFPLWNWDLFKAISYAYGDLLTYKNIDEIWYQFETNDKGFIHKLLYRKSFFEQFEESKFKNYQPEDLELFANWFSALAEMGDEKKNKLLAALKHFLKDKRPDEIFPDPQTRIEMVRFGLWLGEKELFDEVVWIIEKFITDSDPPEPKDYVGDEKFNYHQQILNNEDTNIITTVLGHLAWDIQKLAVRKNYIVKSFELIKKLLKHNNLYVKLQALIPLIEISARRQWLEEYDKENNTKLYDEFRKIVFSLLNEYSQYKAFGDSLTHIFYYFKDLTTEEALEVLNKLKDSREAASLFVYFGIYRKRHYKDKIPFKSELLEEKLKSTILDKEEKYIDLRGSIAWNFWRILEETPDEFSTLKPYLDLFFKLPYNKRYYSSLERIIEEWIERQPEICVSWFTSGIDKLLNYIDNNEALARNTWIDPEKALQFIARNRPLIIIGLVERLVKLWELGAFVGSPREIFETYKLIENVRVRNQAIEQFRSWYNEMKAINPKLEEVTWE